LWPSVSAAQDLTPPPPTASPFAVYPVQVYTGENPASSAWVLLAGSDGQWAIQVGDGCPTIASGEGQNELLSAPVSSGTAWLSIPGDARYGAGESCPITSWLYEDPTPCATHDGVCDVAY